MCDINSRLILNFSSKAASCDHHDGPSHERHRMIDEMSSAIRQGKIHLDKDKRGRQVE
mgnify:CR=1 FL=1